jgi:hypothetical protein
VVDVQRHQHPRMPATFTVENQGIAGRLIMSEGVLQITVPASDAPASGRAAQPDLRLGSRVVHVHAGDEGGRSGSAQAGRRGREQHRHGASESFTTKVAATTSPVETTGSSSRRSRDPRGGTQPQVRRLLVRHQGDHYSAQQRRSPYSNYNMWSRSLTDRVTGDFTVTMGRPPGSSPGCTSTSRRGRRPALRQCRTPLTDQGEAPAGRRDQADRRPTDPLGLEDPRNWRSHGSEPPPAPRSGGGSARYCRVTAVRIVRQEQVCASSSPRTRSCCARASPGSDRRGHEIVATAGDADDRSARPAPIDPTSCSPTSGCRRLHDDGARGETDPPGTSRDGRHRFSQYVGRHRRHGAAGRRRRRYRLSAQAPHPPPGGLPRLRPAGRRRRIQHRLGRHHLDGAPRVETIGTASRSSRPGGWRCCCS